MQRRTCEHCGTAFEARSNRARFCQDLCRQRAHRKMPSTAPTVATPIVESSAVADLGRTVAAALADAGRASTPAGAMCVLLAEQAMAADARTLPALTRELASRLADALKGSSGVVADPVDELRSRRERRGVA